MKLEWEQIEHNHGNHIARTNVFGGWLVMSTDNVITQVYRGYSTPDNEQDFEWRTSLTFVPDLNHEWK